MKNLNKETLIMLIHAQARSADLWITQWERYKDVSGVRNASLAIGKMFGMYHVLISTDGMAADVPEETIALIQKYSSIWEELHISKDMARAISNSD